MRGPLAAGLAFVALTAGLTGLWSTGGDRAYGAVFEPAARGAYDLLGLDDVQVVWRQRYLNQVPFVALVLVTPGLGWRRRLGGLAAGVSLIFASQIALNALAQVGTGGLRRLPVALALVSDSLPFVLWAVIARDVLRDAWARVSPPVDSTGPASRS